MHVYLNRPEPIELTHEGKTYRIRKSPNPAYGRWWIVAEWIMPDGQVGGFHILTDQARNQAELDRLWAEGFDIARDKSGWPIACALMALPPA
jgi:hypothetical protein